MSFQIEKGTIFAIMGGSGCGKSTLLKHLVGLLPPAAGHVRYNGVDYWASDDETQARLRTAFGMLFQSAALWSSMTILENVCLPMEQQTTLDEAQREARLRAIGQQLNEEAARRDAARQAASNLPSSWSSARRGRLFGRTDTNAEMVLYAEAWARKIQLNPTMDAVRELVRQPHTDPLVTVAIRADGTVESVSFYRSSGVPAIDDAVRRIIEAQANYPAFPPALAREYDVIEIRRTWHFDSAIRLY